MTVRDHPESVITEFRGTFDRGDDELVQPGYFISSQNISFIRNGVIIRSGSEISYSCVGVKRIAVYKREGEAQRLLVLDSSGRIWDSVTGSIILTIPTMIDFSTVTMFNRAFITPHNGKTGLPGEFVYLYEGSGTARLAAGAGPSTGTLTIANSTQSGKCETGVHVFAVGFETGSGYNTKYSYFVNFSPAGAKKLDISNIPLGPAGTVARHIYATKEIVDYNGDNENQTYYFVPNGKLSDNTATTITVDFYDADLMDEASYLFEQVDKIPAGVGIGTYRGHLVVWGEDLNSSVVRVSKVGEPESFNAIEGYFTANPGDAGGGVKYCFTYRNMLYVCKSQRTYGTQDNDQEAAFWEVGDVDAAVGTECHGIGRSRDFGETVEERVVIADRSGLRLFLGSYSDDYILTFNIDDIWGRINNDYFHTIEVAMDPVENRIYVAVPLDGATSPNYVLYCDYSEGTSNDLLKWTVWKFPRNPTSIVVDVINSVTKFKIGSNQNDVVVENDDIITDKAGGLAQAIEHWIEFPFFPTGSFDESINHYTGMRARIRGEGILGITMRSLDNTRTGAAPSLVLSPTPGYPLFRGFNFTSEHCSVKLYMYDVTAWFTLNKFILYISPVWEERPVMS